MRHNQTEKLIALRYACRGVIVMAILTLAGCQQPSANTTADPSHPANSSAASSPMHESGTVFDLPPGQAGPPTQTQPNESSAPTVYVCPMHPQVRQAKPGNCPICHMTLEAEQKKSAEDHP